MEFKEHQSFSPMKNNIIDQSSRIYEIISNATKFKKYYNELVNNIIDSMNNQCSSYVRNSKKSINIDIYDNVMNCIDWNALQNKLVKDLKSNKDIENLNTEWTDIGDVTEFDIEHYDIDPIINMYSNYGVDSVKEYAKYMKEAINNLREVKNNVDEFEQGLCEYRKNASLTPLNVCIQINLQKELSKEGIYLEHLISVAKTINKLSHLHLRGLMTIPKPENEFLIQRKNFETLHRMFVKLQTLGLKLDTLSMGMSDDFEAAIAEGATLIRVGTAIFGER